MDKSDTVHTTAHNRGTLDDNTGNWGNIPRSRYPEHTHPSVCLPRPCRSVCCPSDYLPFLAGSPIRDPLESPVGISVLPLLVLRKLLPGCLFQLAFKGDWHTVSSHRISDSARSSTGRSRSHPRPTSGAPYCSGSSASCCTSHN